MARVDTRMWYDMGVEDTPLSDGAARSGGRDGRKRPINGADSSESIPFETTPSSGAHALSDFGGNAPSDGAHTFLSEDRPDSGIAGDGQGPGPETDNAAVGDPPAEGPIDNPPDNDPADDLPVDDPVDDLPDDGPADDGGGMSPVVREYTERLRREALARDAELRARGINPYKGTGVDEEPRRRLGARALVVLAVLVVAAVSVGAYVVFLRGEPDYGMSHGYQVQSDGSLKRPPVTDKAPDKPAEMSKGDEAGAEATARYYLKASAYAWNTGDTGPLKAICDQNCVHCQNAITHVEAFYAHGYWATGGYNDVTETQLVERLEDDDYGPGAYAVQLRFDEHLAEGYTSNGFKDRATYDTIILIHVWWDGSSWRVMKGAAKNAEDVK